GPHSVCARSRRSADTLRLTSRGPFDIASRGMSRIRMPLLAPLLVACSSPAAQGSGSTSTGEVERPPGPWADIPAESAAPSAAPISREIVGAEHILVAYQGAERAPKAVTRTKEAAKKRALAALAKLHAGKATFAELV